MLRCAEKAIGAATQVSAECRTTNRTQNYSSTTGDHGAVAAREV